MKRSFSAKLTSRQKTMLGFTAIVALTGVAMERWTFPAYDRWREQASLVQSRAADHARLARNLVIKAGVEDQFARLPAEAFAESSSEMAFCDFLKRIEAAAGPLLVKVEPSEVKDDGVCAIYGVRLLLSGKLQEIVRFADSVLHGSDVIGLDDFSLRATSGRNMCDCTLTMWMVKLSRHPTPRHSGKTLTAGVKPLKRGR